MDSLKNYTSRILEGAFFAVRPSTGNEPSPVDRKAGVIRKCKILGLDSPNSHNVVGAQSTRYTLEAIREARGLYEGVPVKWNHRSRNAKPNEDEDADVKLGVFRNIIVESDGLYGDFHYNREHPKIPRILEDAERPDLGMYSFSHDADGRGPVINGVFEVRHIPEVRSVDIVYRGATNKTLFESQNPNGGEKTMKPLRTIYQEAWLAPGLSMPRRAWITALFESPCMEKKVKTAEGEYAMGDMPVTEQAEGMAPGEALKAGVKSECVTLINDCLEGDGDPTECLKRLKMLLTAHKKLSGKEEPDAPKDEPPEPTKESVAVKSQAELDAKASADKLARYEAVQKLLESSKRLDAPAIVRKAMMALDEESDRRAILNESTARQNAPRSTSPDNAPPPPDAKTAPLTEAAYLENYRRIHGRNPASVKITETAKT